MKTEKIAGHSHRAVISSTKIVSIRYELCLGNLADVASGSVPDGIHVLYVVVSVSLQKIQSPI
jgi:hypothetical protein